MKTSELIKALNDSLELNGDLDVSVIFNGRIDNNPTLNVDGGFFYIEGSIT